MKVQGGTNTKDTILIIIAVLVGAVLVLLLLGGGMMGFGMMAPWMMGGALSPVWMIVMLLIWLLVLGGAVYGVVWLISSTSGRPPAFTGAAGREMPLDILKRRYASGEITREEYERMRRELE